MLPIWVCLKIVYPIVPNGFADPYPYEKWLFLIGNINPTFSDKPISGLVPPGRASWAATAGCAAPGVAALAAVAGAHGTSGARRCIRCWGPKTGGGSSQELNLVEKHGKTWKNMEKHGKTWWISDGLTMFNHV